MMDVLKAVEKWAIKFRGPCGDPVRRVLFESSDGKLAIVAEEEGADRLQTIGEVRAWRGAIRRPPRSRGWPRS